MKKLTALFLLISFAAIAHSQSRFSKHELSIDGFRNPSIGAEYRYKHVSIHAGYYPTNFERGVTTEFIRTGITYWFLPVGSKQNPSSFYGSISYARGTTKKYKDVDAGIAELGFRWMVYRGLNLRLGVAALAANNHGVKINPTPGVSYSFNF